MTNKVIIFGLEDYAQLAHYYLTHDSEYEVIGFCVDEKYLPVAGRFGGLPVYAWEDIPAWFSVDDVKFFAPMSPSKMNEDRQLVYEKIKRMGYDMISYVSSHATVLCHPDDIGENCFILEQCSIQPFVEIGDNVVIWSNSHIGHHSAICENVTITSNVCVSGHVEILNNCFLGVGCNLKDNIYVAPHNLIGMGACVTKDVKDTGGVWVGNPAKKITGAVAKRLL